MAHMTVKHCEVFLGTGNDVDPSEAPPQPDHNDRGYSWLYNPSNVYGSDLTTSPGIIHADNHGPNEPGDDDGDDRIDTECFDTMADSELHT